jgi:hypothetical protein
MRLPLCDHDEVTARRVLAVLLTCAVLAACGSDSSGATESTAGTASIVATVPATTAEPTTEVPVAEPVTTETVVATTEPTVAPRVVGPLVPEVLCVTGLDREALTGDVYFSVDNQSSDPVVVADPARNVLAGAMNAAAGGDNPLVPTVFGVGRTSPAFLAVAGSDSVSWSLTGPDGVTRTATATLDSPFCDVGSTDSSIGDDRQYSLTYEIISWTGTPPTDVTILIAPTDPSTTMSRCGAGLEALPSRTGLLVNGEILPIDEPLPLPVYTSFPSIGERIQTRVPVEYIVVDRCAYDGVESRQWPMGDVPADFGYGQLVGLSFCAVLDGDEVLQAPFDDCIWVLPTGGSRVRPSTAGL